MKFKLLLMIFFSCQSYSQIKDIIPVWPDIIPGSNTPKQPPIQVYYSATSLLRITQVSNPILTIFEPNPTKRNGTSIIISPGGGYHNLSANLEGDEIAEWLSNLGYTAFVLHYRVPNQRAGALQDLQRAIRIVRANAKNWELDSNKIGVLGFSAGGDLSARASTNFNKETYSGIDTVDSVSSKPNFTLLIYPAYLDQGPNRTLTEELHITTETPPMFLFVTADDSHANSALVMTAALRDAKVPVELHVMPYGGHGYGLRQGIPAAETWPNLAEIWLKTLHKN